MALSGEVLNKALRLIEENKKNIDKENQRLYNSLLLKHPELEDYDNKLNQLGSRLVMATISGQHEKIKEIKIKMDLLRAKKEEIVANIKPLMLTYNCQKCNDTGYSNGKLCDCVIKKAKEICYNSLCEKMPIDNCTFENFVLSYYPTEPDLQGFVPRKVMTVTLKICKEFASTFPHGKNLLFCGDCGLGKTHLSLAIAREVLNSGYSVIYASAQNLINEIGRESFDRSGKTEKIDSVLECDLLILDDLGTEFSTPLSVSIVYNIINTRLLRGLSTIISTNLELEDIGRIYDNRIVSRIVGNYQMRRFIGHDIRQIKALKK